MTFKRTLPVLLISCAAILIAVASLDQTEQKELSYYKSEGKIFGTIYHITYQHSEPIDKEIAEQLRRFDHSLSMFNPHSTLSLINQGKITQTDDSLFIHLFEVAQRISKQTNGAFDMTVAPLVNSYGFGFTNEADVTTQMIDSILTFVGYEKIRLDKQHRIHREDDRITLDASAIAKGYGVDIIADLLIKKGITNFLVEIGGEISCRGVNHQQQKWRVGINKPIEDSLQINQELQEVIHISNKAMATSGNYRRFYRKGGKKYAHTINPKTGLPVEHNLLSATVIANTCMEADALATAFMVMGAEAAMTFLNGRSDIEGYLIVSNGADGYQILTSKGMGAYR